MKIISLTTYFTTKRCVVCVWAHMVSEMLFACILLAASLTMMRSFSCMPHNMVHKVFFASKALLANITSMWSLTSVFANMIYHMFFSSKCLRTVLASARIMSRYSFLLSRKLCTWPYYPWMIFNTISI